VDDHAGNIMPRALGHLGIAEAECERHIGLQRRRGIAVRAGANPTKLFAPRYHC
jgi:predicted N-formylglutamate amidohydrolase